MRIAVDFDGTIVSQDRPYNDVTTSLEFMPGAKDALLALKRAGHALLLWSGRASRSLLYDHRLDPLVRAGTSLRNEAMMQDSRELNLARYRQMVAFVMKELPGVFDAIDDGLGGKPSVDLFIDDRAIRLAMPGGWSWTDISVTYGEPEKARAIAVPSE